MSTESISTGRRKYPRKSFRKTISFLCLGKGGAVEGIEIGEGGISFRSNRNLELSEKVIVNFFIPEGDFFSVVTTLKNVQPMSGGLPGEKIYGLSFDEVSIPLKRQVRAYVARTVSSFPMY